jgi:hypothetical protein
MASHASDLGDSLNRRHRGGQTEHHGDDVCGESCVDARRISGTIPTVEKLRGGSFLFPPESLLVKLLIVAIDLFMQLVDSIS